uniref:Uncharacterized protein n=1 Tax=Stegastes partitus TaxID=144197 RepID=A0A3B4Z600_9TELE
MHSAAEKLAVSTLNMLSEPNADCFEVCMCERLEQREDSLYFGVKAGGGRTHVYVLSKPAAPALLLASVCNTIPLSNSASH